MLAFPIPHPSEHLWAELRGRQAWGMVVRAIVLGASGRGELLQSSQTHAWELPPLHRGAERTSLSCQDGKDPGQEGSGLVCAGPREAERSGGSAAGGTCTHKEPRSL